MKKANRFLLIVSIFLLASLLSACTGSTAAASWPGLAADENAAYLANGSLVYAIRLKDGEELWSFPEKPSAKLVFYANPVLTPDGNVIVGSSGTDHLLYILDSQTGSEIWSFTDGGDHWVASPLVEGNMMYAPNADGTLYVFDLSQTGNDKLAWKLDLGGKLWSSPVSDGQNIYLASLDHHVYAIDSATHEIKWKADLAAANTGAPALAEGVIIVGSFSDNLVAFNTSDGSSAWSAPTKAWIWASPVVDGSTVYAADLDGNFYTLNAVDGSVLNDTIHPDGTVVAAPTIINGRVYLATEDGKLYAIDAEGRLDTIQSWSDIKAKLYTAPVLAGNLTLVATFKGDFLLVALNQDGQEVWHYPKETK